VAGSLALIWMPRDKQRAHDLAFHLREWRGSKDSCFKRETHRLRPIWRATAERPPTRNKIQGPNKSGAPPHKAHTILTKHGLFLLNYIPVLISGEQKWAEISHAFTANFGQFIVVAVLENVECLLIVYCLCLGAKSSQNTTVKYATTF
jgi:hypothetical protein